MKVRSLCKQLLLAGSIAFVAAACQCQKKEEAPAAAPSEEDQSADDEDSDECCGATQAVEAAPVEEKTVQAAPAVAPAEPVAEAVAAPSIQVATPETPKLEAVRAVTENRSEDEASH